MSATTAHGVEQLEAVMRRRLGGRVCGIHLAVCGDGLLLQGVARSQYAKQVAQQMAIEGTDLPLRANEIRVIGAKLAPECLEH